MKGETKSLYEIEIRALFLSRTEVKHDYVD